MIALTLAVAAAFAAQDAADTVEELRNQLKDEAANVRIRALRELTKRKASEAAEEVIVLLKDPEWDVRYSCIGALEAFADRDSAPLLKELFRDNETTVVLAAVRTLGNWGIDAAYEDMISLLKHAKPEIRQ